jgi:adenosine deaminase
MNTEIRRFIRKIPKAELHIHLEGSLEPELMFAIAERNGVVLPFHSAAEVRQAYRFSDLQSFLDIYYEGMGVLLHERDFHDMTVAYLARAHGENVRHAELFFDPQAHSERGVGFDTVIRGIRSAQEEMKSRTGISVKLIPCLLRHLSAEAAMASLEEVLRFREWIAGVGLDSSEAGNPPERFSAVFARARAEGLHVVAHAGEEGPPEYIRQALDILGSERIDHGVRCIEDPELAARLAKEQIPLTVCPLSNVRLRVFNTMADHNLKKLLDMGLRITLNSDDPAYFGGYITENYLAAQQALDLDRSDILTLARNSFLSAFLTPEEKILYLEELERFVSRFHRKPAKEGQ